MLLGLAYVTKHERKLKGIMVQVCFLSGPGQSDGIDAMNSASHDKTLHENFKA